MSSMIRLNPGNDTNGNPRRLYVLLSDDGTPIGAWEEGYEGSNAVPQAFRHLCTFALLIPTTRSFCRRILRDTPRMPSLDDTRVRKCSCGDCVTGKIPASGCSLPAHEYTEVNGTRCWNCGKAKV